MPDKKDKKPGMKVDDLSPKKDAKGGRGGMAQGAGQAQGGGMAQGGGQAQGGSALNRGGAAEKGNLEH